MINIENLRKIYNFIDALPDERVNMSNWRSVIGNEWLPDFDVDLNVCGTAACVVGWLPVIFDEESDGCFWYDQFSDKVGCTFKEAMEVCEPTHPDFSNGEEPLVYRTKQDALRSMRDLAYAYGHTI